MLIKKVQLHNFRQFYGDQVLTFPYSHDKNVTIIHAENGFGKTSILNAVLWAFFRETTPKFERPDDIVNYEALEIQTTRASVEVEFEFEGCDFRVERVFHHNRDSRNKTDFSAYRILSGSQKALINPEVFISSVIPQEMARYFFFDGEAAESFASSGNQKKVSQAIRNILGCAIAETAIGDLRDLSKQTRQEIGDESEDQEIRSQENALNAVEKQLEAVKQAKEACEKKPS